MKKSVVDMVVAKMPPPDKLKKGGYTKSDSSYDDDVGEESAFEDFCAAMGVKPKDAEEARRALSDYVAMCVASHLEGEGD